MNVKKIIKKIPTILAVLVLVACGVVYYNKNVKADNDYSYTFTYSGNTYDVEFNCISSSAEKTLSNFCIDSITSDSTTAPLEITVPDTVSIGSSTYTIVSIGGGEGKPFMTDDLVSNFEDYDGDKYSVTLPSSIDTINDYAFSGCTLISSVDLSSVETIGDYAFNSCVNISSVDLSSVETIGDYAFNSCGNILKVVTHASCTTIGNGAFYGCNSYFKMYVLNPNTDIYGCCSVDSDAMAYGKTIYGYSNSTVKDYCDNMNITFGNLTDSKVDSSIRLSSDTSRKVTLSVDDVDLYTGNYAYLNGKDAETRSRVFNSYAYVTDDNVSDISVNPAYSRSVNLTKNYNFTGFYTTDGKQIFDADGKIVSDNISSISSSVTLTAQFTGNEYEIYYYGCVNLSSDGTNEMTIGGLNTDGTAIDDGNGDSSNDDMVYVGHYYYGTDYTLPTESDTFKRTGYDFAKWGSNSDSSASNVSKIPAGAYGRKSFKAYWTQKTYSITYETNGGTFTNSTDAVSSHTYASKSVKLPTANAIKKDGYDFGGWYENSDFSGNKTTSVAKNAIGDKTYYAKWTLTEYEIAYDTNGGSFTSANPSSIFTIKSNISLADYPITRTGYTFTGWVLDGEYVTAINCNSTDSTVYSTRANVTLLATWKANTYDITCYLNNGSLGGNYEVVNSTVSLTHTYDKTLTLPTPTRKGYTFLGWSSDIDNSKNDCITSVNATTIGDTSYYAQWKKNTYTITYDTVNGSLDDSVVTSYTITSDDITLPTPTKEGYTFKYWMDSDNNDKKVETIASGSTGNRNFKALWSANTYTISYELNSDSADLTLSAPKSYTFGETTTLDTPIRSGYTFLGWYETSDFSGSAYTEVSANRTGNITFYAKWLSEEYTITYDFGLAGSDAVLTNYKTTFTAESVETFATPTWVGHTFVNWDLNGTKVTSTQGIYKNITIKAIWNTDIYVINYELNGGEIKGSEYTKTHSYGSAETLPTPTRTGYTFKGWYMNAEFTTAMYDTIPDSVSAETTFYAKWVVNTYHVYYDLGSAKDNGGTISADSDEFTVNEEVELLKPSWVGHNFNGWVSADNSIVKKIEKGTAKDATLTASWNTDVYTITYETNGGTINNVSYNTTHSLGDSEQLPTDVVKTGYDFDGWYDNAELSGDAITETSVSDATNLTYYAKWSSADFTYTFTKNGGVFDTTDTVTSKYLTSDNTMSETYGEYVKLPAITKTGKVCKYWSVTTSGDYSGQIVKKGDKVTFASNLTFEPIWGTGSFNISFDADTGTFSDTSSCTGTNDSEIPYKTVVYGEKYGTLPTAERDGYEFTGWVTLDGTYISDTDTVKITSDTTLYAKYKSEEDDYSADISVEEKDFTSLSDLYEYTNIDSITVSYNDSYVTNSWFKNNVSGYEIKGHYYDLLSDDYARNMYLELYDFYGNGNNAGLICKCCFSTTNVTSNDIHDAIQAFYLDHSEITWLNGCSAGYFEYDDIEYIYFLPTYSYNSSEALNAYANILISNAYNEMLSEVTVSSNDADTVRSIANVICDKLVYIDKKQSDDTYSSKYRDGAYIVFQSINHEAVCVGYANIFKNMCNYFGIDCINVSGTVTGGGHEWNYVKVGSKFYGVDLTWYDGTNDTSYVLAGSSSFNDDNRIANATVNSTRITSSISIANSAYSQSISNGYFKYTIKGKVATLTGLSTKGKKAKTLTIPSTIKRDGFKYTVNTISDKAFNNDKVVTKVVIGKNIKSIGKSAFNGCKKLKTISILTSKLSSKNVKSNAFKTGAKKTKVTTVKSKVKSYKTILKKTGLKNFTIK